MTLKREHKKLSKEDIAKIECEVETWTRDSWIYGSAQKTIKSLLGYIEFLEEENARLRRSI